MSDRITARDLDGHPFLINDMGWAATLERLAELEDKDIHAKWIFDDFDGDGLDYQCSNCHRYSRSNWNYCPNCGATMES